jgi:hypothetical protein
VLGASSCTRSPCRDQQTRPDQEQHTAEARVTAVTAHRGPVDEIRALPDENRPDNAEKDAEHGENSAKNAHIPVYALRGRSDSTTVPRRPRVGAGREGDPPRSFPARRFPQAASAPRTYAGVIGMR